MRDENNIKIEAELQLMMSHSVYELPDVASLLGHLWAKIILFFFFELKECLHFHTIFGVSNLPRVVTVSDDVIF